MLDEDYSDEDGNFTCMVRSEDESDAGSIADFIVDDSVIQYENDDEGDDDSMVNDIVGFEEDQNSTALPILPVPNIPAYTDQTSVAQLVTSEVRAMVRRQRRPVTRFLPSNMNILVTEQERKELEENGTDSDTQVNDSEDDSDYIFQEQSEDESQEDESREDESQEDSEDGSEYLLECEEDIDSSE